VPNQVGQMSIRENANAHAITVLSWGRPSDANASQAPSR
jgi:hypothetical protein